MVRHFRRCDFDRLHLKIVYQELKALAFKCSAKKWHRLFLAIGIDFAHLLIAQFQRGRHFKLPATFAGCFFLIAGLIRKLADLFLCNESLKLDDMPSSFCNFADHSLRDVQIAIVIYPNLNN